MPGSNSTFIINPQNYKEAIRQGSDFYIQFSTFSPEVESTFSKVLHVYLEKSDLLYMKGMLYTVLKEIINNAIKANVKRLYFKMKGLNIKDEADYRKGMVAFKKETYGTETGDELFEKLRAEKLTVRVQFKNDQNKLIFHIINNIQILVDELAKIEERIEKAYAYNDISEAFDDVLDDSEGAGLGLIMALMLFKNIGLPQQTYRLLKKENMTVSIITIPQNMVQSRAHKKLTNEIINEVERLPSFPANVIEIQRLCNKKDSTIKQISEKIRVDPGLTADLLKLANSAGYITSGRTDTIEDAVKVIGLKGLNTLLVASGVQKVIQAKYKRFEKIWHISHKRAFYAQRIAIQLQRNNLSEFVYLAGLLADIGTIILLSLNPERAEKIREIAGMRGMETSNLLEEMSLGISHATLGKLILSKWKFNQALIKTVEFHNRPYMAPEKFKELIYIVYLANFFSEIEDGKSKYELIDEDVLENLKIKNKEHLQMIHKKLLDDYENTIEKSASS